MSHATPTHAATTTVHGHADEPKHDGAPMTYLDPHPQIVLPKSAVVHIIVGLVLTYAGLFTMMTVMFAAWGAWLATVGPMYVALMLPLSLRNAEIR